MADNYTALKSSQKKRYISKETFNSLDLSTIPVGSEYEVVNPIEKGDLSADINNALNKAEKSISEPTNQTTGSDGDVLVKKGGGSEWKSISTPTVVQGTGQSTTDVMSQKATTDSLNSLEAKLNENAIKDSSKTYLVVNGNVQSAVDLGPNVVYDVDWGDGIVQTSQTTKLSHTYEDGYAYHLVTITSTSEYCKNLFAGLTSLIKIVVGTSTPLFLNNNYIAFEGDTNLEEIDLSHCGNSLISDTTLDLSTTKVNKLILPKNLDSTPESSSQWLVAPLVEELTIPATLSKTYVITKGNLTNLKKLYLPRTESILTLSAAYASVPDDCKVIVPKSLISAYKSAAGWSMIADKIVYEVDSSDLPDMSNVAYTNKNNTFTKSNVFTSPQRIRNEVRVYPQDSYEPNDSFASFGISTNYKWGSISAYNKDEMKGVNVAIPGKTGTLALTSDVDAKSSFSVEVW